MKCSLLRAPTNKVCQDYCQVIFTGIQLEEIIYKNYKQPKELHYSIKKTQNPQKRKKLQSSKYCFLNHKYSKI